MPTLSMLIAGGGLRLPLFLSQFSLNLPLESVKWGIKIVNLVRFDYTAVVEEK